MLIRRIVAWLIAIATFLSVVPAYAERDIQPPEDVMLRIEKTCRRFTYQDNVRCEAREKKKWWQSLKLTRTPRRAYELYDKQDFGQGHLRERLQAERRAEFRKNVQGRKTYRQFTPTEDVNTTRRTYLNDLRQMRLDCMLEDPGRPRALCFDRVANWARKQMRLTSGSMRFPAE